MLPGFTGISQETLALQPRQESHSSQGVTPAGFWDWLTGAGQPSGRTCEFVGTDTKCEVVTLWCKNNYRCCCDSNGRPYMSDGGWYLCGACVGLDW